MRTALISPTEFLREIQPLSDYHLILTHKVIYDHKYQEFYAERSKAGDYILLDNSAAEKNGRSTPLKDITLAAVLTKPKIIFLPDYLFDSDRTLDELENALRSPHIRFLRRVLPDVKFAAVVQGIDPDDWLECFGILNNPRNGIEILGIPKITNHFFGKRIEALKSIAKKVKKPCHLLGVWYQAPLSDLHDEAQFDFVVGIDTPKPVRLAVAGLPLSRWNEVPRGKDFLERKYGSIDLELLRRNCEGFVEVCSGNS